MGRCPNCKAVYIGYNDHDTGKSSPDKWACDTYTVIHEWPNFQCTHETFNLIIGFLTTHSDPSAKLLAKSLKEDS